MKLKAIKNVTQFKDMKKGGLGKGLDLIFAENTVNSESTVNIKINEIEPNREQPRKEFNDEALSELADSISQHGIIQPLIVRPIFGGGYQIVAGERRWRASRMAGLTEVPVIIRDMDDAKFMEIALIENLQREDLTPLEAAKGYNILMEIHDFTQEEVAKSVGKSRPAITNALRLLSLPEEVCKLLDKGLISAGHGRTLLGLKSQEEMIKIANLVAQNGISVRELEKIVKKANKSPKETQVKPMVHYYEEVRLSLNESLGRKIKVDGNEKKGTMQIEFYGEEDLNKLLEELSLRNKEM